ncbi:MAG: type II toxin-antitoxin system HigB family toxin [Oculatellaceae cyanobacterium Prado106]|jgi:mRNA interferase HigB|nr:type II toxin-antitoxin system HigB family toxin [Oculatellaceae cyanobacterium Prado106]
MHILGKKRLREFCQLHADGSNAIYNWYRVASKASWQSAAEMQSTYPKAEVLDHQVTFTIKESQYRLTVDIFYPTQRIYVKQVLRNRNESRV